MRSQSRIRIGVGALVLWIVLAGTSPAQVAIQQGDPGGPKAANSPREIELALTPKAASTPIFRHRLLPMSSALNPGDAAPIYLRLGYELQDGALREANRKAIELLDLPFDKFPVAEARALVDRWSYQFLQIEYGTRRRACDWNYTIPEEADHVLTIRLAEVQTMRTWGRLLALKARAEIAEGKTGDAIRTIQTGLAFGRHVGGGPFFINVLVGIAIENLMLDRVDELVGRPDAPNLYWALTALPRPLIDIRQATETERALSEWLIPEIDGVEPPRPEADWSALLVRLHARMVALDQLLRADGPEPWLVAVAPTGDLGQFRATMLPRARAYLESRKIAAKSDDQALVLAIAGGCRELFDEFFKGVYLDYPDAAALEPEIANRVTAAKGGPAALFAGMLPAVQSVQLAEARLDRKVAALRAIEALRLHAAGDEGRLPDSLDRVKAVPVPGDPLTGKPFGYVREGGSAILTGAASPAFRLVYRLAIRK